MRQPYVQHLPDENLNTSYVLTNSNDFFKTVERIAYTLNQNHFTGKDFRAYEENEKIIEDIISDDKEIFYRLLNKIKTDLIQEDYDD